MANQIVKDTLHPENEKGVDIYPKTSIDQVEGYTEEREDIDNSINDTNQKIITGLAQKVDKSQLNSLNVPNTVALRDENGRMQVGDAGGVADVLNLRTGRAFFPNVNTTPLVEAVETVYGRHNGNNAAINVNKLLANVTSPIITFTALETVTSGTITEQDLATLQGNKNAMILFANEYYYLADDQHTSGYLTYSHVGVENGVQWIKSITITIANLSWVKTVDSISKKQYIHTILFIGSGSPLNGLFITFINYNNTPYSPPSSPSTLIFESIYNIFYISGYASTTTNYFMPITNNTLTMSYTTDRYAFNYSIIKTKPYLLDGNSIFILERFDTSILDFTNFTDTVTEI